MSIRIGLNGYASIEPRRVILQVYTHKVGIDRMGYIGRDHEAIRVHLGQAICSAALFGEGFTDALEGAWEKVAVGALPKKRTNFLIVETSNYFDCAGISVLKAGGNECFDGGERT